MGESETVASNIFRQEKLHNIIVIFLHAQGVVWFLLDQALCEVDEVAAKSRGLQSMVGTGFCCSQFSTKNDSPREYGSEDSSRQASSSGAVSSQMSGSWLSGRRSRDGAWIIVRIGNRTASPRISAEPRRANECPLS